MTKSTDNRGSVSYIRYLNRILILSLAILLTFSNAACGGNTQVIESTASIPESASESETSPEPKLPEKNYNGADFTLLNGNTTTWMTVSKVTTDEENGEIINDSIYARNRTVEEKFGVTIKEVQSGSIRTDLLEIIASGDKNCDLALIPASEALAVTLEGGATNYSDIPYVDTSMPWWVNDSANQMSIGGKVYFAISQFDTTHYDGVRALFFNKQMIKDFTLESPYQLVYDGKWTLEAFKKLGMAVASDLNGDSIWGEGDCFGYTSYQGISAQSLCSAIGSKLSVSKDMDDLPFFDLLNEQNLDHFVVLTRLLNENDGFRNPLGSPDNSGGVAVFTAGRALFYHETLSNIKFLRNMEQDFGIIPSPKFDEKQENYKVLGGYPYFMLVPITTADIERTGIIMESLAYESLGRIDTAFYDKYLQGKLTRDEDSVKMLDIIFTSLDYAIPIANSIISNNIQSMVWNGSLEFASEFATIKPSVEAEIDKVMEFVNSNK